jgi:hypothetical protein
LSCYAKPAKKPADKTLLDEVPSSVQSLYDCRAKVIITHTPNTPDACEMHARPAGKFVATPALRLYRQEDYIQIRS